MLSSQRQNKHRNAHTGTENDVRNDGDEPDGECQDERFGRRELPDSDDSNDDDRKMSTSSTQRVAGSKRRIEDIDVANDEEKHLFPGRSKQSEPKPTAPNSPTRHCVRLKVGQRSLNSIVNDNSPKFTIEQWKVLSNQFVDFEQDLQRHQFRCSR